MSAPGYRHLFVTYPFEWRVRFQDEVLAMLRDADGLRGRVGVSTSDRVGFLLDGLAQRFRRGPAPDYPWALRKEHRFDQSNGLSPEREPTAFENEHSRWWDRCEMPGFVPVAMTGGRPQVRT